VEKEVGNDRDTDTARTRPKGNTPGRRLAQNSRLCSALKCRAVRRSTLKKEKPKSISTLQWCAECYLVAHEALQTLRPLFSVGKWNELSCTETTPHQIHKCR